MFLNVFTLFHVLLSLIGIASRSAVKFGLVTAKPLDNWTSVFLVSTLATSITGFLFPFHGILPAHIFGILSLIALAIAVLARYRFRLAGPWRWAYVVTATLALYLNVFILVVQLFRRVPALKSLAPRQSEPPFAAAQFALLVLFAVLGILAARKFRTESRRAAELKPVPRSYARNRGLFV